MKYDDVQMLRSLTGANTNAAHQNNTIPQQNFEDLAPEEIDRLALQKHAEMTVSYPSLKTPQSGTDVSNLGRSTHQARARHSHQARARDRKRHCWRLF